MTDASKTDKPTGGSRSPLRTGTGIEAVGEGLWVLHGQGQSFVAETSAGLVVIDAGPGGAVTHAMITALRTVSQRAVQAVCFSHGHIGYNTGVPQWLEHAASRNDAPPRLIAHRNLPRRYARYRETLALQQGLAEIQFRQPQGSMHFTLHDPNELFDDGLVIGEGASRVELRWAPAETDDGIAMWCPAQQVLYGGPAVLHSIPNIGTPLRTLRDTVRWADTLDGFAQLAPVRLVREFGGVIEGAGPVRTVLTQTAAALRWVRAEVVRLMNHGLNERQILAVIEFPEDLFGTPWMKPVYGDPSFIVRDIYRSENGWWDRNPTSLHPGAPEAVATALADAIADKPAVLAAARQLADAGQLQLALHVIDLLATAGGAAPEIAEARQLKAGWLRRRALEVPSYVSRSLYESAAVAIEGAPECAFGMH